MIFYGLTKEEVLARGSHVGEYYVLDLGDRVEISVLQKNKNKATGILSSCVALNKVEDKFGVKYSPNNKIYFDAEFLLSETSSMNNVSYTIDRVRNRVIIGDSVKYDIQYDGFLTLSGRLSLNGYVSEERPIYFSSRVVSQAASKVQVLSVGALGNTLFGLYHIAPQAGVAIGSDDASTHSDWAISTKTGRGRSCPNWHDFYLGDWFETCDISVVEDDTDDSEDTLLAEEAQSEANAKASELLQKLFGDNIKDTASNKNVSNSTDSGKERLVSPVRLTMFFR